LPEADRPATPPPAHTHELECRASLGLRKDRLLLALVA
jgi:hypothetical protein